MIRKTKINRIIVEIKNNFAIWIEFFVCGWPDDLIGKKLRRHYWKKKYKLATDPDIGRETRLAGDKGKIFIGNEFVCGEYVEISFGTSKGVYIGNHVAIARGSYIRSGNHSFDHLDIPIMQQGHDYAVLQYNGTEYSVVIEDDVWIGAYVILLSGAKIGKGSVIAAGSVVSAEIPPYSIVVGNPARVARIRKEKIV